MEARITRAVLLAAALVVSMGASYRTPNFIVNTGSPQLAEQIGKAAEKYRRELAIEWLGKAMPNWSAPCMMTVRAGANLGAGGATTFVFDRGQVFDWRMTIQGSVERIFDSVLPHEITHMVFASHFRCPLPRWADEGGATAVEHPSELAKHRTMLVKFLKTNRGIAFGRMFALTEYPRDIMPLYAQGYSLAEFLIQLKGKRAYVAFLTDGLKDDRWSAAIRRHYGVADLGALQNTWLAWVRKGSPRLTPADNRPDVLPQPSTLLAGGKLIPVRRPGSDVAERDDTGSRQGAVPSSLCENWDSPRLIAAAAVSTPRMLPTSGWHAAGSQPSSPPTPAVVNASASEPIRTQTAHPQPIEKSRQRILEWGKW